MVRPQRRRRPSRRQVRALTHRPQDQQRVEQEGVQSNQDMKAKAVMRWTCASCGVSKDVRFDNMKKFGPGKHKCSKQSQPQAKEANAKGKDGRPSVTTLLCHQVAAKYGCDWLGVLVDNTVHVHDSLISSICVMRWQCWGCTTNFDHTYNNMKSRGFVCDTCNTSQSKEDKKRARQTGSKENKQRAGQAGGVVASREDKQRAGQAGSKENKQRAGQAGSKENKQRVGQAGSKENKQRAGQAGGVVASREDKQRAGQAGSKENKQRAGQAGSKENKQRVGQAGSKENMQCAGQAGGVVASREDKQRAGQAGSKENKQRAGQAGSKENKQRAGQAGSKEDKQRAGQAGSKEDKQRAREASPKEDKQRARQVGGQAGSKEDKQRAGQFGAVRRALNYARETVASQSTQAIQHMWERGDEIEPPGSVVDEEEEAMLQSGAGPSPDEFTGSKVGTSLASTVRGFWEQTGIGRLPLQPAANLESCESLEALMRAILDEKVDTVDMVALAKEWHKKRGVCEDIQSCGCCGVRDFNK